MNLCNDNGNEHFVYVARYLEHVEYIYYPNDGDDFLFEDSREE